MSNKIRLFIAAPIPDEFRKNFFNLSSKLKEFGGKVKWVEEENYHLTLKFLGSTDEEKIDRVIEAVTAAVVDCPSCRLVFKGLGAFPNLKRPRVFWAGVARGGEELARIASNLEDVLEPLGFKREKRKFSAHLTLGRVRSPKGIKKLTGEISKLKDYDGGGFDLKEIHLIRSDLSRHGPTYTVVKRFPLADSS